jgi:hypothetical protein
MSVLLFDDINFAFFRSPRVDRDHALGRLRAHYLMPQHPRAL